MKSVDSSSPARRLWLVRHGETTWNALGLVQGHTTQPTLTVRGVEQARQCARALAAEPVVAVYSSDLRRAVQTAGPIAHSFDLDVIQDHRLRERALGIAEGTPSILLEADRSGIDGERVIDPDAAPHEGESIRQLYWRAAGFVDELLDDTGTGDVVIVCHGGVVRVVQAWLDGIGPDEMSWPPVGNGLTVCRSAKRAGATAGSLPA